MEFRKPQETYLNRLSGGIFQKLRPSFSVPSGVGYASAEEDEARDFQLHKQRIEAELELITKEALSRPRRRSSGYAAVTVPSSVKHQVIETQSAMARPRSPPRKKEVDHMYLQGLLDDQLAVIRQQLNSLSSERLKMEQKMEDLMNGIKDAHEQCARIPRGVSVSTPGSIRRARSMEARKPHMIKLDSQLSMQKRMGVPPLEEDVDGERMASKQFAREPSASMSSLSSSLEHRDSDINSLSTSPSVFSFSVTSFPATSTSRRPYRPTSVSDFLDGRLSPTPIPELPESPNHSRSMSPQFFATYHPRIRSRSSFTSSPLNLRSEKHEQAHSQPSPSHFSYTRGLLSTPEDIRPRSGSLSLLASPQLSLKTRSSQDIRSRPSPSPAHKRKSPAPELRHAPKDQQLSYFRKNSLTDVDSSCLSITDDECELKGSSDNLSQNSSSTPEHDALLSTKTGARVLRRSSLTGQIEHVANLKMQVRRNSFNTSPIDKFKHGAVKEHHSLSINQKGIQNTRRHANKKTSDLANTSTSSRKSSKVVFLDSKETTV